ncbi:MAG: glycoside hydrolase family 3 C-terminal domain-containing protein [Sphingomonas sp.]|uniref:glycoside hydrolase family 3 protein n=1 Tax=Sphingomonas sp. TaxID=28214 RepID=UPI0025D311AA|nr:glycoside hydrolase family 3 C-terminal domain-containing protein [Sphingomonas sp.]MBX3563585.1 glycoside hydrolase family 3 C-terminal domain-containing protein [Sphingomonas sp.]
MRNILLASIAGTVAVFTAPIAAAQEAGAPPAAAPAAATPPDAARWTPRVRKLLSELTLDEKLGLFIGGFSPDSHGESGYVPGVPRLGIPALSLVNGPTGVENNYETTAVPTGIGLAATFNDKLAYSYGQILGWDARASGSDVLLGPQLDLARSANWGRNYSALGEDPLLTARLGAAQIKAIQATGTMATAKHFLAHNGGVINGDGPRAAMDIRIDERTQQELYLLPYEAAFKADLAAVMASYAFTNGRWSSENRDNLTGFLRHQFGWGGFVMSDWTATHSTADSLRAGLDLEMPGYGIAGQPGQWPHYFGDKMKEAIAAGQVSASEVDVPVGRILTQMEKFGMFDGTRVKPPASIDVEREAAMARAIAVESGVLLRNEGNALPLKTGGGETLGVIGPTGGQLAPGSATGRSTGFEARLISPLDALRRAGVTAEYAVGNDQTGMAVPATYLRTNNGAPGLKRRQGDAVSVDPTLDFVGARALPAKTSANWSGMLTVPETGRYLLMIQSWGGSAILKIDGKPVRTSAKVAFHGPPRKWTALLPTTDGLDNGQSEQQFEAGKSYQIDIEELGDTANPVQIRLAWVTPEMRRQNIDEAVALARRVKTPVVFAWNKSGELAQAPQTINLPDEQDALIEAVAAANPNTIVVLNTGNPVAMPWRDKVKAILEMWYPGQEGGWATADLLLGKANPSGKLPITFPKRFEDTPVMDPDHPERRAAKDNAISYSEGLLIGYRWYDTRGIQPLYAFGHGLSYTQFRYSGLKTRPKGDGAEVRFTVTNTGKVAGAETAQVYLAAPPEAPAPMPSKSLVGFDKVNLAPGRSATIKIEIPARAFSYWSAERKAWTKIPGPRTVLIGGASDSTSLTGTLSAGN